MIDNNIHLRNNLSIVGTGKLQNIVTSEGVVISDYNSIVRQIMDEGSMEDGDGNDGLRPKLYPGEIFDKTGLHGIISYNTTEYWNQQKDLIPKQGHIIIYSDYMKDGLGNNVPGLKVADGKAFLIDQPFIISGIDNIEDIINHIKDTTIHTNSEEKKTWNQKVSIDNNVTNETIVFK